MYIVSCWCDYVCDSDTAQGPWIIGNGAGLHSLEHAGALYFARAPALTVLVSLQEVKHVLHHSTPGRVLPDVQGSGFMKGMLRVHYVRKEYAVIGQVDLPDLPSRVQALTRGCLKGICSDCVLKLICLTCRVQASRRGVESESSMQ